MKKIYMLAIAVIGFVAVNAQSTVQNIQHKSQQREYSQKPKATTQTNDKVLIWESDFSDPSEWELTTSDDCTAVYWQIGVGLESSGGFGTPPVESTTQDNGYAMVDSDFLGAGYPCGEGLMAEDARMTMATAIDLTDYEHVIVEYQTNFRTWNDDEGFLVISTDGTWPDISFGFDETTNDNVYRLHSTQEDPVENPTFRSVNISSAAGGQSNVKIRINYVGQWGYTWYIDDFKILEQPENDVRMEYSIVSTKPEAGVEYGNVPVTQLPDMLNLFGRVLNFGYTNQHNVTLNAEFSLEGTTIIDETLVLDSMATSTFENFDMNASTSDFTTGLYVGAFTLTSDEEQDGNSFGDNVIERQFGITDHVYSLDGMDVYANPTLSQRGPGSFYFNNNPDDGPYPGGMIMTYYNIEAETYCVGVNMKLGSDAVAGAQISIFLADSSIIASEVLDVFIASSSVHEVTDADITAGEITMYFDESDNTIDAGAYYVGVIIEEDDFGALFRVIDDLTIPQPQFASRMVLDGTLGVGGSALAIRMLTTDEPYDDTSINNEATLDFSLLQNTPNPANSTTVINYNMKTANTVSLSIVDVTGKIVKTINEGTKSFGSHSLTLDVKDLSAGVYSYTLTVGENQITKRMIIE